MDIGSPEGPFSAENLWRLFNLEVFDKLCVCASDADAEMTLLPFSANMDSLDCTIQPSHDIQLEGFNSLRIVAKNLKLEIELGDYGDWNSFVIPFLNRVAELSHFERLALSVNFYDDTGVYFDTTHDVAPVTEALIAARNQSESGVVGFGVHW